MPELRILESFNGPCEETNKHGQHTTVLILQQFRKLRNSSKRYKVITYCFFEEYGPRPNIVCTNLEGKLILFALLNALKMLPLSGKMPFHFRMQMQNKVIVLASVSHPCIAHDALSVLVNYWIIR